MKLEANAHIMEVKEEVLEIEEDHKQQQQQQEPYPESEDRITIDRLLGTKGKQTDQHFVIRKNSQRTRSMNANDFKVQSPPALDQAEKFRATLDHRFPSFVKLMLRSHVTYGFSLDVPMAFCRKHMPKHDEEFILEDENGQEYKVNFLASKARLSRGWKHFSIVHKLLEVDAVVYHLVETCKFKLYILRDQVALGLSKLGNCLSGSGCAGEATGEKRIRTNNEILSNKAERFGEESWSSLVDFQNFDIIVNNNVVDSQLSEHTRLKYYELCRSQNSYLHLGLLKSISGALAAGIILDAVSIADSIKSSKISTSKENFALWDKTLAGFELLGMNVGFLRARIKKLERLAVQSGDTPESKRYKQAKLELDLAEEEMKTLEIKHLEFQKIRNRLNIEMEALNMNLNRDELKFMEEARVPW